MCLNFGLENMLTQVFVLAVGIAWAAVEDKYESILDNNRSCVREPRAFGGCLDDCDSPQFCMNYCEDNHADVTTFMDYWPNAVVCEADQCWCNCYTHTCDAEKGEVREIPVALGLPVLTYKRTEADEPEEPEDDPWQLVLNIRTTCARDPRAFGGCLDGCGSDDNANRVCHDHCLADHPDVTTFIDVWTNSAVCGEDQCWCNCYTHTCIPGLGQTRDIAEDRLPVWTFQYLEAAEQDDGPWEEVLDDNTTCVKEPRAFGQCIDNCNFGQGCKDKCLNDHGDTTTFIDVWTSDNVCEGTNRCWCNCYEHTCDADKGEVREIPAESGLRPVFTLQYVPEETPAPTEKPTKDPTPTPTVAFCSTYEFHEALCREVTRFHKPSCKARGCKYDKITGYCHPTPRGEEITCKKLRHSLEKHDKGEKLCECYSSCTPRYLKTIHNYSKCTGKHSWPVE